ncbi:MAG: LysR substrate-binding domain-containing protein, partial [Acidobacteriota bacterium]
FLAPAGVRPARVSKLGLSEAIFETVRAGLGISAAPSWLIKDRVAAGELVALRLGEHGLIRPWQAALLRRRQESPALQELLALLRRQKTQAPAAVVA